MGTRCWFINWKFTSSHSIQVSDNTAKKKKSKLKEKKVKNHYVVTQTSSALQITQQKGFSWAPGEGLTRWPPCISQRAATRLSLSLSLDAKEYFVSTQPPESASAGDSSGDLADGKALSQENSSLGNVTSKDEVLLFVMFVSDIPSNESVLHTGKSQLGLEIFQSLEGRLFSFFLF